jgi:hypothetical protein
LVIASNLQQNARPTELTHICGQQMKIVSQYREDEKRRRLSLFSSA